MTRTLSRTKFHSSQLIRCLADLEIIDAVDSGEAFAQRMGQWIHFADAISLSAVHNGGIAALPKLLPEAMTAAYAASAAESDRVQGLLKNSIIKSFSSNTGKAHMSLPIPKFELPVNLATAYVPYRRFYEAHQRDMELHIQALRFNVREAVAKASPRLKKLAELDATLEKILREREKQLLSKLPVLLKKRFEKLFKEHQEKLVGTGEADDPASWAQPGGWLAQFCRDMQRLLLAELELRLQPALGLIEASKQNTQDTQ